MPRYQYACTSCGEQVEAVQRFTDDPLTVCPACGGSLRKVFLPVGIVFKGSGFYRTDSRNGQGGQAGKEAAKDAEPKAAGANGSGDGAGSADKKKAPADTTKAPAAGTDAKKPSKAASAGSGA